MSHLPVISVVIPTWNRKEQVAKAVQSAIDQKEVNVEVLVCDDGSDDGTQEMIAQWRDSRVCLIVGPRAGRPAIPRNRGIRAAKGEWLAFLDDDDVWQKDKLWKQLEAAQREGCLAACSDAERTLEDGSTPGRYLGAGRLPLRLTFETLLEDNMVICSSALVHASLFRQVLAFPESLRLRAVEDYALWLRVAALTDFACVDEGLLLYKDTPCESLRRRSSLFQLTPVYCNFFVWAFKHGEISLCLKVAKRNMRYTYAALRTGL